MDYADQLLQQCLARYPHGVLFLFLEARLLQVTGKIDEVKCCDLKFIVQHLYEVSVLT